MASRTVAGVFDLASAAEQARTELLGDGVPAACIQVLADLNADGIAGEFPGQSYENQPGQCGCRAALPRWLAPFAPGGMERRCARYGGAVRSGACVVAVDTATALERRYVEALLRRRGARHTGEPACPCTIRSAGFQFAP